MIKISVPNDDHVALRAMAKALEEIAVARGAPALNGPFTTEIKIDMSDESVKERLQRATSDLMQAAPAMLQENNVDGSIEVHGKRKQQCVHEWVHHVPAVIGKAEFDECNNCGEVHELKEGEESREGIPTTDSTGTPWDERIHSASKALNADGTWRLRRKPKDMDEGGWADYVEQVSNELKWDSRQLGASEEHVKVVEEETLAQIQELIKERAAATNDLKELLARNEPSVTPEGDDFHVDTGVVTEQQVASFPPPPPVPASLCQCKSELPGYHTRMCPQFKESAMTVKLPESEPVTMTFPQVMAFLTERHGRITSAQVDQIIADMGLEKITDLNTQPEHTGPFIARVKALLGE